MPTLKGTEASLSYVQCFLYLLSSSMSISIFHSMWLDTFWTDLVCHAGGSNTCISHYSITPQSHKTPVCKVSRFYWWWMKEGICGFSFAFELSQK